MATRLHHCIVTFSSNALLALSVGIELVSSSARVTSVKYQQPLRVTDIRTQRSDPLFFREVFPYGQLLFCERPNPLILDGSVSELNTMAMTGYLWKSNSLDCYYCNIVRRGWKCIAWTSRDSGSWSILTAARLGSAAFLGNPWQWTDICAAVSFHSPHTFASSSPRHLSLSLISRCMALR